MKIPLTDRESAFTLIEAIAVGAVLLMLVLLLVPASVAGIDKKREIECLNNLKQLGVDERMWEGDQVSQSPSNPRAGRQKWLSQGNLAVYFQSLSNELSTPLLLHCPSDMEHTLVSNFPSLSRSNISYFMALNGPLADPESILAGDDNLVANGRRILSGLFTLGTTNLTWSKNRHHGSGNILIADGSVQSASGHSTARYLGTNTLVLP